LSEVQEWLTTLGGVHAALRPGGYLVFESVDPAGQPWLYWNREVTYVRRESADAGVFESWLEVTRVDGDMVSTRRTYVFAADGATLTSEGIRRYPPRSVIEDSLISAGYELMDVRGAPERPILIDPAERSDGPAQSDQSGRGSVGSEPRGETLRFGRHASMIQSPDWTASQRAQRVSVREGLELACL
jgi:hypothetical protein